MSLLQQTQELLQNPNATLIELNAVYVILKGQTCRTPQKIRYTLQSYLDNPQQFERAIAHYNQDMAEKAEVKHYRFTKAYQQAGTPNIILHAPFLQVVKHDQLTDAKAELLEKHPHYHVYVERIEVEKPLETVKKAKRTVKSKA
jgi:hypothetical protein